MALITAMHLAPTYDGIPTAIHGMTVVLFARTTGELAEVVVYDPHAREWIVSGYRLGDTTWMNGDYRYDYEGAFNEWSRRVRDAFNMGESVGYMDRLT